MSPGWLVLALVVGQSEADREAELFGAETESSTLAAPAFGSDPRDEAALFGADTATASEAKEGSGAVTSDRDRANLEGKSSLGRLSEAVEENNDFLALGGELWLFGQAAFARSGDLQDTALSSPNFMDVYLDVRPTERLRAYARARLNYDFTIAQGQSDPFGNPQSELRASLDQLWLKFDVLRTIFVTAGKQRIRWGSSRIWNPTDFLNQSFRDPFNFLDLRLGVPLLKLHLPVEAYGWNFYAIANLEDAASLKQVGGALRAELAYDTAELSLSAAFRKDAPLQLGADLSVGFWLIDFRAELALTHHSQVPRLVDRLEFAPTPTNGGEWDGRYTIVLPDVESRYDDWEPQLVLGLDFNIPIFENDSLILGAEYFYNRFGYSDANLYPILLATSAFNPLYASRHYLGISAVAIGPGDLNNTTFVAYGATSLSDHSYFARLQYSVRVLTYLDVGLFGSLSFGQDGALNVAFSLPNLSPDNLDLDRLNRLGLGGDPQAGAAAAGALGSLSFAAPRLVLGLTLNLRL